MTVSQITGGTLRRLVSRHIGRYDWPGNDYSDSLKAEVWSTFG